MASNLHLPPPTDIARTTQAPSPAVQSSGVAMSADRKPDLQLFSVLHHSLLVVPIPAETWNPGRFEIVAFAVHRIGSWRLVSCLVHA